MKDLTLEQFVAEVRGLVPDDVDTIVTSLMQHCMGRVLPSSSIAAFTTHRRELALHVSGDGNREALALFRGVLDWLARINPRHPLDGVRCTNCENLADCGDPEDAFMPPLCEMHAGLALNRMDAEAVGT